MKNMRLMGLQVATKLFFTIVLVLYSWFTLVYWVNYPIIIYIVIITILALEPTYLRFAGKAWDEGKVLAVLGLLLAVWITQQTFMSGSL